MDEEFKSVGVEVVDINTRGSSIAAPISGDFGEQSGRGVEVCCEINRLCLLVKNIVGSYCFDGCVVIKGFVNALYRNQPTVSSCGLLVDIPSPVSISVLNPFLLTLRVRVTAYF